MGVRYKKPRKFNLVSLPIYLAVAALIYAGIMFVPHYYRNIKVDEVVRATVNEYWRLTRGAQTYDAPPELHERTVRRIRELGVEDPKLGVYFERVGPDLKVSARYEVVVTHPLVKRRTILRFSPEATTPLVDKR